MAYTNIDDPSAHFQTKTYTGTNNSNGLTNDGNSNLQPDFIWIKRRDYDNGHQLLDSTRGVTKILGSELNSAETTLANRLSSFDTDGFTVESSSGAFNADGEPFVAWQWKATGGTTTSVSESSYNAGGTYQKNETAGFSIVSYTGIDTVGEVTHGLTTQPQVVIVKRKDDTGNWATYHESAGITGTLFLNTTAAKGNTTAYFHTGWGSATKFPIGSNADTNADGATYVAYVFSERQGYSKFGSYVGTGNVNGPFVYTGFQPAWLLLKRSDSTTGGNWHIIDNKRSASGGANVNVYSIVANAADAESTGEAESTYGVDFLSNGFKIRASHSTRNALAGTYVYMAFAENPFTTSTGIPTTAR